MAQVSFRVWCGEKAPLASILCSRVRTDSSLQSDSYFLKGKAEGLYCGARCTMVAT